MRIIGLTGNIAAGKSAVAKLLVAHGARLIDADVLAREAVAPGTPALDAIVARWGPSILSQDGSLDRGALRRIIFADADERHALDAIVHPAVRALRDRELQRARAADAPLVVVDIPLLFESGLEHEVDIIVLVDAPIATRRERLMHQRGLSATEADAMIAAQMPSAEKRSRAHIVLDNTGSLEDLARAVDRIWPTLAAPAHESSTPSA